MTVVFVDMDDVLCSYTVAHSAALKSDPIQKFPQSIPGFFQNLAPITGGIVAVNELRQLCDVFVLSAPSTRNPHSYTEKRLWIERNFDYDFTRRLILSPNKGLLKGDYLIDDRRHPVSLVVPDAQAAQYFTHQLTELPMLWRWLNRK